MQPQMRIHCINWKPPTVLIRKQKWQSHITMIYSAGQGLRKYTTIQKVSKANAVTHRFSSLTNFWHIQSVHIRPTHRVPHHWDWNWKTNNSDKCIVNLYYGCIDLLKIKWKVLRHSPDLSNMSNLGWKVKGQLWPLKLIHSQCLIRLTYQARKVTLASTVFKKSSFKIISHLNAFGSKFDLDIK